MTWSNNFTFNEMYASYYGGVDSTEFHHHAAIQIVFSLQDPVRVLLKTGTLLSGKGFLIRPLVDHKIECDSDVAMIYLEPQALITFAVLEYVGLDDIEPLTEYLLSKIDIKKEQNHWMDNLIVTRSPKLELPDQRLAHALELLQTDPGGISISFAAKKVGISESRLRTLVRKQIGVPISTWLIWRKLNRSAIELMSGATLAEAAMTGGFSDQAHFTRTMKRMFGITPRVAAKALDLR